MSDMVTIVNRNILKGACGMQITCSRRSCQQILDWRQSVMLSGHDANGNPHSGVLCASCWDKAIEGRDSSRPIAFEVLDGREL